jgi:hypothetical protein
LRSLHFSTVNTTSSSFYYHLNHEICSIKLNYLFTVVVGTNYEARYHVIFSNLLLPPPSCVQIFSSALRSQTRQSTFFPLAERRSFFNFICLSFIRMVFIRCKLHCSTFLTIIRYHVRDPTLSNKRISDYTLVEPDSF